MLVCNKTHQKEVKTIYLKLLLNGTDQDVSIVRLQEVTGGPEKIHRSMHTCMRAGSHASTPV